MVDLQKNRARQTERRGKAGPVRLPWRQDSPAASATGHRSAIRFTTFRVLLQQLRCFLPERAEFLVGRLVPVHPLDGLLVPLAGFGLVAKLSVCHGEEEPVVAIA